MPHGASLTARSMERPVEAVGHAIAPEDFIPQRSAPMPVGEAALHAIILAGGKGARLRALTDARPKALAWIGNQPIIEIIVRQLREAGFARVTLCVSYLGEMIEKALGDGDRFGVAIDYCRDTTPLGTAGPLRLVPGWHTAALVMNCDILTAVDLAGLYRAHQDSGVALTVGYRRYPVPVDFGVLNIGTDGHVVGIWEKPSINVDVASGIYVADPEVREYLPEKRATDMPALVATLIGNGRPVRGIHLAEPWHDIGTPDSYGAAQRAFCAAPRSYLGQHSAAPGGEKAQPDGTRAALSGRGHGHASGSAAACEGVTGPGGGARTHGYRMDDNDVA
jgi:NDP-sugar pyrophosphorylase family protein